MKKVLNVFRNGFGWVIALMDYATRPDPVERSPEEQRKVEKELEQMSLYQFHGCPFCVKVRRTVHRLNLPLEFRDARNNSDVREELKEGGGKVQVPCLRIDGENDTEWMYESDDIIEFFERKFG